MKHRIFFLCIVLLAIALRFWKLGSIPFGITHDEMGYIYNAYSIAKTGENVFGEFLPLFTWMTKSGFPFMPVPMYSMVPLFWIFPLTPTISRLLPAIMGILDIFLLYYIVHTTFRNKTLAYISALFLAISPWHLHFTRSAYDPNYSLFYFLCAIAAFLYALEHKKSMWMTTGSFILALFSYRGMSIIFVPLALVLLWYAKTRRIISVRQTFSYIGGVSLALFLFLLPIIIFGKTYTAEGLTFLSQPKMQEHIDSSIREAKGPLSIRRFFANKPTYILDRFRENYIKAYSPEFLFLYTEPNAIYSIWSRGRLYFIDVMFIIIGFLSMRSLHKTSSYFWYALLLIGGLPGAISGMPYSARNFFLSVVFPVFSAAGVLSIYTATRQTRIRAVVLTCIVLLYTYALGSYVYDYYGRYAHQGAEAWAKSIKDISLLAHEKQYQYSRVIVGKISFGDIVEYGFWNRIHPSDIQQIWQQRKQEPFTHYSHGNIIFSERCLDQKDLRDPMFRDTTTTLYITVHSCNNEATPSGKIEDYFGNPIWKIFEFDIRNPKSYSTL